MATRYIQVRVLNSAGVPQKGIRVSFQVFQILAGGFTRDEHTDSDGIVNITLDADNGAEVMLYVGGKPQTKRESPKGQYTVYV